MLTKKVTYKEFNEVMKRVDARYNELNAKVDDLIRNVGKQAEEIKTLQMIVNEQDIDIAKLKGEIYTRSDNEIAKVASGREDRI